MAKLKKETVEVLEVLQEQEKMPIMIPIDPLNPQEPFVVVLNGCIYSIPRGKMHYVPKDVFLIIQESLEKTIMAKQKVDIREI